MPQIVPFLKAVGAFVTAGAAAGTTAAVIGATVVISATVAASRALMPKINFNVDDNDRTRQQTVRSTIEPRKLVYGETMVSGPLTYAKVTGTNNEDLHQVVALAGHELTAIKTVFFDDKSIDLTQALTYNSSTKEVISGFFGPKNDEDGNSENIVYIDTRLGTSSQTAFSALRSNSETSTEYLATHRGDNVAAIYTRWRINEGSAEVWDEVGNVQNIKCVVQGKKVYDPRLDVHAGNDAGDNPTTAAYIVYNDGTLTTGSAQGNYNRGNQGENPALQLADFLMNSDFGLGIPASKIDWAAVVTAADLCDQLVPIPSSAVQKRFFGSGVIFGADTYSASISKILSAMNGSLIYSQGKYVMAAGKYVSPSETLTEDDLVGPVQIKTAIPRSDRFNTIKGLFIDPTENYKMMEFGPVTVGANDFNNQTKGAVARDNGEVLTEEVKLPFTDNRYAAQRIALMQVAQSYHQTIVTVPVNLKGMRIAIGDRVNITLSDFNAVDSGNWAPKIFKCIGWRFAEDGEGINLTLIEDDSNNYNDPESGDYSTITAEGVISTALPDVPSPSQLTLTSAINSIELNWKNPPNTSAWEQIYIYRNTSGTLPTDSDTPIAKLRATSYIDQRAADGTEYYYWIQAVRYPQGSTPAGGSANKAKSPMVAAGTPASGKIAATKIGVDVMGTGSVGATQVIDGNIGSAQIAASIESSNYDAQQETGWQINKSGTAFFQEATIKGGITASSGTIGGTTITSTNLNQYSGSGAASHGDADTDFWLDSSGNFSLKDKFVWTGGTTNTLVIDGSGTFSGAITATSGTFTGTVNASAGDFSGQIAVGSTAGTITVIDGNDTDYRMFTNATLDAETSQYLPDDSSFKVGNDGRVFASNITIYNTDGDVLLSPSGLGAAALNDISTTSGSVVSTVGGTVSNSTSEITITTSSASESFSITSKVALNDNYDGTQYFSGASTSSTASAEAQLTGVDVLIDYYVKADGGSYSGTPSATQRVTIVNSGTPSSTQMRVGGFDRGSGYSGSLTRYFAVLQDFGGALEIIPNSGGGATSYVVTTAALGASLFPTAQTYKVKIVVRVVEDGTTTVISGSTTPPSSNNTTTGIYFDGGNSDERHYEITGSGLIKSSDNVFTSGGQNLLSSGGTISGNLVVTGDLTVQGTTTTVDTDNLTVKDNNITLNYSTGDSTSTANNAGITIQDAVDASTDASILWKTASDTFEFSHKLTAPSADFSGTLSVITADANESILELRGTSQGTGKLYVGQSATHGGGIEYNGDATPSSSGAGADYTALYRRSNSTDSWTARNFHSSEDWEFRNEIIANSALNLRSAGGVAGVYFQDTTGGSASTAFRLHSDVDSTTVNIDTGGSQTIAAFVNNGNLLITGTIYADGAASNSLQWETGYDYSQIGHLPLAGGTLTGALSGKNATFDNGTNTTVDVIADDDGMAQIRLYGANQGTGRLFVGQDTNYGGGIEYNGDNSPSTTGAGADYIALFRNTAGTFAWTARNYYDSNNWSFRGNLYASIDQRVFADDYHPNADALTTARLINGVSFDGTANITVADSTKLPLAGGTLTDALNGTTINAFSAIGAADNIRTGLRHHDTSAMAAGVGGQLVLGYRYITGGSLTEGAIIKTYKENATSAHYGSGLKFQVRNHGQNLSTKMSLDPSGSLAVTGNVAVSGNQLTVNSDFLYVQAATGFIGVNTTSKADSLVNILNVDDESVTLRLQTGTNSHQPLMRWNAKNSSGTQSYADIKYNPDDLSFNFNIPYNKSIPTLKIADNVVTITSTVLGAEPYAGLVVKNTATTGAAYTGVAVDAKLQSHYRYLLDGVAKWQTRAGSGSGGDQFSLYSWVANYDVLRVESAGQGQFLFGGATAAGWTNTSGNGGWAFNAYNAFGSSSNATVAYTSGSGGYSMFYLNRLNPSNTLHSNNRYFDFYRTGVSKMWLAGTGLDEIGFVIRDSAASFAVWDTANTKILSITDNGVLALKSSGTNTIQMQATSTSAQTGLYITDAATPTKEFYVKTYGSAVSSTVFGQSIPNTSIVATTGSADAGLLIGTLGAQPVTIGTSNAARLSIAGTGNITASSSFIATNSLFVGPGVQTNQYGDTSGNGTLSINHGRTGVDAYIAHSAGANGYAMYYLNRISPQTAVTASVNRFFDFTHGGTSKARFIGTSNNEFGFYMNTVGTFNIWNSAATLSFTVDDNRIANWYCSSTWDNFILNNNNGVGAGLSFNATNGGSKWSIISQGSGGGIGGHALAFHLTTANGGGQTAGYKMWLTNSGLTVDAGTSTVVDVMCDDAGEAQLRLMGTNQGTGRLFVGQSALYGGGIEYSGDNSPASTGAGADFVTLYRNTAGSLAWTAKAYYSSNDWQFRGNVTAYASDERLKENITLISDPIEKVKRLRGVEFDWKDSCEELGFMPSMNHETGVIAQDVAKVIPDAAIPAPFDENYLTVQKEKIVPLLIEAIKEQQTMIEKLTSRLEKLENGDN